MIPHKDSSLVVEEAFMLARVLRLWLASEFPLAPPLVAEAIMLAGALRPLEGDGDAALLPSKLKRRSCSKGHYD